MSLTLAPYTSDSIIGLDHKERRMLVEFQVGSRRDDSMDTWENVRF